LCLILAEPRGLDTVSAIVLLSFLFPCPRAPRALPSFPTRRSSDLAVGTAARQRVERARRRRRDPCGDSAERPLDSASRGRIPAGDRKSTRLNSSHVKISYAVFCLKKKKDHILNQSTHQWHHDITLF